MNAPTPCSYLHPRNSLTYGSVLAGLLAFFLAAKASWNAAWSLITVSVFLDTFDGKFAGLFERSEEEKAFGVQFDSLADAVTFGLVPVACLYLLMDPGGSSFFLVTWSSASLVYLTAGL
ncbi:MAG: CDP-alcohol phosphatidyltransferase family protein, partial [bacterium]